MGNRFNVHKSSKKAIKFDLHIGNCLSRTPSEQEKYGNVIKFTERKKELLIDDLWYEEHNAETRRLHKQKVGQQVSK